MEIGITPYNQEHGKEWECSIIAVNKNGLTKRATCCTFRRSFGTHLPTEALQEPRMGIYYTAVFRPGRAMKKPYGR